jgi:hypothetical protein
VERRPGGSASQRRAERRGGEKASGVGEPEQGRRRERRPERAGSGVRGGFRGSAPARQAGDLATRPAPGSSRGKTGAADSLASSVAATSGPSAAPNGRGRAGRRTSPAFRRHGVRSAHRAAEGSREPVPDRSATTWPRRWRALARARQCGRGVRRARMACAGRRCSRRPTLDERHGGVRRRLHGAEDRRPPVRGPQER